MPTTSERAASQPIRPHRPARTDGRAGYRFARYYTHGEAYRRKGPPELWLRLIAPVVVMSTVIVFASGVVLLFDGPARAHGAFVHQHH